jgi:hypothetical protein
VYHFHELLGKTGGGFILSTSLRKNVDDDSWPEKEIRFRPICELEGRKGNHSLE